MYKEVRSVVCIRFGSFTDLIEVEKLQVLRCIINTLNLFSRISYMSRQINMIYSWQEKYAELSKHLIAHKKQPVAILEFESSEKM
jgi:hypothetical protein